MRNRKQSRTTIISVYLSLVQYKLFMGLSEEQDDIKLHHTPGFLLLIDEYTVLCRWNVLVFISRILCSNILQVRSLPGSVLVHYHYICCFKRYQQWILDKQNKCIHCIYLTTSGSWSVSRETDGQILRSAMKEWQSNNKNSCPVNCTVVC